MKKVILTALMLVLITSVGWANSITLSPDSDGSALTADGGSGAIPVPPKGEHNTGEDGEGGSDGEGLLAWDDGIMDATWEDSSWRAVRFTAPFDCHLTGGLVYLSEDGVLFEPYYFAIYDEVEGAPGSKLGGMLAASGGDTGWDEINIIPVGLLMNAGDVFYGVVTKPNGELPYLGADTTEPIHGNFYKDPSQMGWAFDETANFMLRVVVDDDMAGPATENPNPGPGDSGVHGDTAVTFEVHDGSHEVKPSSITVVVDGREVTDECSIVRISMTGGYLVTFKPEKDFDAGDVYVYWNAEDALGNGGEDTWYFTVDDFSDDSNTEETSWGVIKDKF